MRAYEPKKALTHTRGQQGNGSRGQVPDTTSVSSILQLQRTAGNQAVQQLIGVNGADSPVRPRTSPLVVATGAGPLGSRSLERHERDAEQSAASIAGPVPQAKRSRTPMQSDMRAGLTPTSPAQQAVSSPGQPLEPSTRAYMESRFGEDFSEVRVHTDPKAMTSAQSVQARAYTVGRDIVFGHGQYVPGSRTSTNLLAHELAHVVQQQTGVVPEGTLQRSPDDFIEVDIVRVSRAESELLYLDTGVRLPGSPPRIQFGNDGPIPEADRKMVQLAFDLAYSTAASPTFAAKFAEFKKSMGPKAGAEIPGIAALTQQKYLNALNQMVIHLADTSKNPQIQKELQEEQESSEKLPIAGYTPIGSKNVYIRSFALKEGRDALASLILHESFHVAGVPTKPINEFLNTIMEFGVHGFEASVGLPLSQIVAKAAQIEGVEPHGQGLKFTVRVLKPDQMTDEKVRIEIFDSNRQNVFSQDVPKSKFTKQFVWNGLDRSGKQTESGMHSIRVISGNALFAAYDYILRRKKK